MIELNLVDVFRFVGKNKKFLSLVAVCSIVVSSIIALMMPNIYKSSILAIPSQDSQTGGLAALAGQFGGLASMAGINLGGDNQNGLTIAIESLKSKRFLHYLIDKYDWKPLIMGVKSWDMESNTLQYDESVYSSTEKVWVREVDLPFQKEPSLQEVHEEFIKNNFKVVQNLENGTIEISIRHVSPSVAKSMVDSVFLEINEFIRTKDITEAEKSIAFLKTQISNVDLVEMKTVFFELIEQQTQTLMLANIREEYYFETIEPSLVAEFHVLPNRLFIVILGLFLGVFFGIAYCLLIALLKSRK